MKLKGDAKVSAAGRARPDTLVLTVTDLGLAKVTEGEEFPSKGRGTGGVRSTKLGDAKSLSLAHVGSMGDITVIVGRNDEPNKSDPAPQPLSVQPTRRDLASTATHTPILGAGSARW